MRPAITSFLLLLFISSCSEQTLNFADPASAIDQGEQALIANEFDLAQQAFLFASTDTNLAPDALYGLFKAQAAIADENGAQATLAKLQKDHSDLLTTEKLKTLADYSINVGVLDIAEQIVALNLKMHPNNMERFRVVIDGIEAKRSGNAEALAELGYVGD